MKAAGRSSHGLRVLVALSLYYISQEENQSSGRVWRNPLMSLGACSLIQQLTATVVNAWNPLRRVVHIRDMVEVPLSYTLWLDRRVVSINHKALPYRAGILTAHSGFH